MTDKVTTIAEIKKLADVFWYLCRICEHFDVDLAKAVEEKTVKNVKKYPAGG